MAFLATKAVKGLGLRGKVQAAPSRLSEGLAQQKNQGLGFRVLPGKPSERFKALGLRGNLSVVTLHAIAKELERISTAVPSESLMYLQFRAMKAMGVSLCMPRVD